MRIDPTTTAISDLTDAEARDLRALCEQMRYGQNGLTHPLFQAWAAVARMPAELVGRAFFVHALFALLQRAEAERGTAEQRLRDLRTWAAEIAEGQSDTPEGRRVAGDFRAVVYRIDGEERGAC